jgi:hypothetical protein
MAHDFSPREKVKKEASCSSYDRVNTTNGVSPPAGNRLPPFVMSQQTTCKELSLSTATWLTALRVRMDQVNTLRQHNPLTPNEKTLSRCGILN